MAVELPAWLTKKVGPLPVGAYVLIGGVGLAGIYYYRKRASGGGEDAYSFNENEGDDVYGVPIESPEDEYAPSTPPPAFSAPPGTGGFILTPLPYDPIIGAPDEEPAPDVRVPVATCQEQTLPARRGAYPSAPNRDCPQGWHRAVNGPCAGHCIRNRG